MEITTKSNTFFPLPVLCLTCKSLWQLVNLKSPLRHYNAAQVTGDTAELAGWKIIREMLRHIWPRDQPSLKARVVVALGLLVGAKVHNIISL